MTEDKLTALFDSARNAPLETSSADVNKWIASAAVGVGLAATLKVFFTNYMTKIETHLHLIDFEDLKEC